MQNGQNDAEFRAEKQVNYMTPLQQIGAGYMQTFENTQHARCECHECTQARWRMSLESKLAMINPAQPSGSAMAPNPAVQATLEAQKGLMNKGWGYQNDTRSTSLTAAQAHKQQAPNLEKIMQKANHWQAAGAIGENLNAQAHDPRKGPIGHYEPAIAKIVAEGQQGKGFIG